MPPVRNQSQRSSIAKGPLSSSSPPSNKPLQRGTACLQCRKRKLKCGAEKPACSQCVQCTRASFCSYEDPTHWGKQRRMQLEINILRKQLDDAQRAMDTMASTLQYPPPLIYDHILRGDVIPQMVPPMVVDAYGPATSDFTIASPPRQTPEMQGAIVSYSSSDDNFDSILTSPILTALGIQRPDLQPAIDSQPHPDPPLLRNPEMTPTSRAALLKLFFLHASQLNVELTPGTMDERLGGPVLDRPHDALLNAMYLIACRFGKEPSISRHETTFRQRAQHALEHCATRTQDLCDCIQACYLLALYCYLNYYPAEAGGHLVTASNFAARIKQPSTPLGDASPGSGISTNTLLSPPSTVDDPTVVLQELTPEQRLVLQQAYTVDRLLSSGLDKQCTFPSRFGYLSAADLPEIVTGEEHNKMHVYEDRSDAQSTETSPTRELSHSQPPAPSKAVASGSRGLSRLRAQSAEMFWAVSSSLSDHDESLLFPSKGGRGGRDLQSELAGFRDQLPSIHLPPSEHEEEPFTRNVDLCVLSLHTQVCSAVLQAMRRTKHKDVLAQEACSNQLGEVLALIRELVDGDYQYLDPIVGLCWQWVVEHIINVLAAATGLEHVNKRLREAAGLILVAMNKLAGEFPIVFVNIANVEDRCRAWGIIVP